MIAAVMRANYFSWATNLGQQTDQKAAAAYAAAYAAADVWWAISGDFQQLADGTSPADLAITPLWPKDMPNLFQKAYVDFQQTLSASKPDWSSFLEWYEARLFGGYMSVLGREGEMELTLTLADKHKAWWERDIDLVNHDISVLLADLRQKYAPPEPQPTKEEQSDKSDVDEEDVDLPPAPSAVQFGFNGGSFIVLPQQAKKTVSDDFIRDIRTRLLEEIESLFELQRQINARLELNIQNIIDRLKKDLGNDIGDLKPAHINNDYKSLSNRLAKLSAEGGSGSSLIDQQLDDIAESVFDLRACFSEIRELERAATELDVRPDNAEKFFSALLQLSKNYKLIDQLDPKLRSDQVRANLDRFKEETPENFGIDFDTFLAIIPDHLLTQNSFTRATISALRRFGKDVMNEARGELVKQIGRGIKNVPKWLVLGFLAHAVFEYYGTTSGISRVFKPYLERLLRFEKSGKIATMPPELIELLENKKELDGQNKNDYDLESEEDTLPPIIDV